MAHDALVDRPEARLSNGSIEEDVADRTGVLTGRRVTAATVTAA
jgi:hypothetical protein